MQTKALLKKSSIGRKCFWTAAFIMVMQYMSVKMLGYPFLYCWFHSAAFAAYDPIGAFLNVIFFGYMLLSAFRLSYTGLFTGFLLFAVNLNLPNYATIIFQAGGSCGL